MEIYVKLLRSGSTVLIHCFYVVTIYFKFMVTQRLVQICRGRTAIFSFNFRVTNQVDTKFPF